MGLTTHLILVAVFAGVGFSADVNNRHYYSNDRYPVGGSLRSYRRNAGEDTAAFWYNEAQSRIRQRAPRLPDKSAARNVVMFLGDGMSVPTLAAARTLLGQREGGTGEEAQLSFEKFPGVGLAKTYCVDAQISESACTATAYLCGVKANVGTLGVTAAVQRTDCDAYNNPFNRVPSIAEWALADGRDAGIVTTTRVTQGSPGGSFAKSADRHWETDADVIAAGYDTDRCPDITHQLVHMNPGRQFKVILGGGRQTFLPTYTVDEEGGNGTRTDHRNLIEEWQKDKADRNVSYEYVWHREQLMALSASPPEYLLGLFENDDMQYNMQGDPVSEPTLAELTEVAIRSLSRNEKGFFLFVEGGRIDHAHHYNLVELALDETIAMAKAVEVATKLLSEDDSLIVVTADHTHVMSISGYTARGGDILGVSDDIGADHVPYMTVSYANGPGARPHVNEVRQDVTKDRDYRDENWMSHADVPLEIETHGGDDVGVFALGPQHLLFSGVYEQSQIPHLMAYAACIGPGAHACDTSDTSNTSGAHLARPAPLAALAASLVALLAYTRR